MPSASAIGSGTIAVLALSWGAAAEVVIDMPPPPAAEVQKPPPDAADAGKATPAPEALVRFGDRSQAQDSAGNPRGVDVPSTWTSSTSFAAGGYPDGWGGWGDQWYDGYNWGWPGYWALTPIYWGGGWGGWGNRGCSPWGGGLYSSGVSMGWGGSSTCISGAAAVNLRLGNWGW